MQWGVSKLSECQGFTKVRIETSLSRLMPVLEQQKFDYLLLDIDISM